MTDAEIIKAVREGTHTLVPMPVGDRKFFIGNYGDCDITDDNFVLILDLYDDKFEGEEMIGRMMGDLRTRHASDCALPTCDGKTDDEIAFG